MVFSSLFTRAFTCGERFPSTAYCFSVSSHQGSPLSLCTFSTLVGMIKETGRLTCVSSFLSSAQLMYVYCPLLFFVCRSDWQSGLDLKLILVIKEKKEEVSLYLGTKRKRRFVMFNRTISDWQSGLGLKWIVLIFAALPPLTSPICTFNCTQAHGSQRSFLY